MVGAFDRGDRDHAACSKLLAETQEQRVIPSPVLVEVDYFLGDFAGTFLKVLDEIEQGAFAVEDLEGDDYKRVEELLRTYADLEVGFVDAAPRSFRCSFALLFRAKEQRNA